MGDPPHPGHRSGYHVQPDPVLLGVVVAGGIYWCFTQPPERRDTIKKVANSIGTHLMGEYGKTAGEVYQGRLKLRACLVPKLGQRTPVP